MVEQVHQVLTVQGMYNMCITKAVMNYRDLQLINSEEEEKYH